MDVRRLEGAWGGSVQYARAFASMHFAERVCSSAAVRPWVDGGAVMAPLAEDDEEEDGVVGAGCAAGMVEGRKEVEAGPIGGIGVH